MPRAESLWRKWSLHTVALPRSNCIELYHSLKLPASSSVIEIQSSKVKNVTWLNSKFNTCRKRRIESNLGIVELATGKDDTEFEVPQEHWVYDDHSYKFE